MKEKDKKKDFFETYIYSKGLFDKKAVLQYLLFPLVFIYLELTFHMMIFDRVDVNLIPSMFIAIAFGSLVTVLGSLFPKKANRIVTVTITVISCVWFGTQLVYHYIFKTFLSLYSVGENGGDVLEFWKEALHGIEAKLPGILVLLLPIPVVIVLIHKLDLLEHKKFAYAAGGFGLAMVSHLIFLLVILIPGKEVHSAYDLYHNDFVQDLGVDKIGVLTATRIDIKNIMFGVDDFKMDQDVFVSVNQPVISPSGTPTDETPQPGDAATSNQEQNVTPTQAPNATSTPTPPPTPTPIDTSPNVLDIDFAALAENESKDAIASLDKYFANVTPTNKNEYTGMFEGYNLIFLTAEGFSPYAVDETITPTLYKLTHTGFVFENFYNPIWWTSTSDGEYVNLTSLIPNGTNSFTKSADCDMPLCPGWQFKELGYTTRAFHDHTYTYYHRDRSHPNVGYDYKGVGNGLEVKKTWPESDLEMMQVTIPEYVNDEKFHTYYMTVSGHMEYTFIGNSMATKNKEYVKDLPYSDECKAYIACNKELDLALEYLLAELEKAGVLDKTVIVMSADHYPYGLAKDKIDELAGHEVDETFELYKNNLIIWNAGIKEPVVVDKYCCAMDIMPTVYNLFGVKYDSRLYMGQDIFSDAPALVFTSNQSFITDYVKYNSKTGEVTMLQDVELPEDYIKNYVSLIRNKFNVSASIIKNNYFKSLLPSLNLTTYQKPDTSKKQK